MDKFDTQIEKILNMTTDEKSEWLKKKFIDVYEQDHVKCLETSSSELEQDLYLALFLIENDPEGVQSIMAWDEDNVILRAVKITTESHYVNDFVEGKDGFVKMHRSASFVTSIIMWVYH